MTADIGPYSLQAVCQNLADKGYSPAQISRVRQAWLDFHLAQTRLQLAVEAPDVVVMPPRVRWAGAADPVVFNAALEAWPEAE